MRVVGLMSGTSMDAIDVAVVDIGRSATSLELSLLGWSETPWPTDVAERFMDWTSAAARLPPDELAVANMELGELFAKTAAAGVTAVGSSLDEVDLVSSHGQTLHHAVDASGRVRGTLQIGEPAVIAERTGVTVVADFRPRDVAAGGQGAPLVSYVDARFFADPERTVAALNLGGMANVTIIPAGAPDAAVAFDTGPGNALIDAAARHLLGQPFDLDGRTAATGRVSDELLGDLLAEPYFTRRPPKSTGRELFGDAFAAAAVRRGRDLSLGVADVLATFTELTARSVAEALARWAPDWPRVVHVSGGGASNAYLVRRLVGALERDAPPGAATPVVSRTDELGVPVAAKEALAFAVLGHETVHGRPNNVPGATGARNPTVLGAVWPGANYARLMDQVLRSRLTTATIDRIAVIRPSNGS